MPVDPMASKTRAYRRLAAAVVVALLCVVPVTRLSPSTDLLRLLPDESQAARSFRLSAETFGMFESIFVLTRLTRDEATESSAGVTEGDVLYEATWWLEDQLAMEAEVADVRSGLSEQDERFFLEEVVPRGLLLLPEVAFEEALSSLDDAGWLVGRVDRMKRRLSGPTGAFEAQLWARDPLGFASQLLSVGGAGPALDPFTSSFVSADGSSTLLVITPSVSSYDSEAGARLDSRLRALEEEAKSRFDPGIELLAIGGPLYAAHDEKLLRRDLELTFATSGLACLFLLILAFGGWRTPASALSAVLCALLFTGAFLVLGIGSVSALSLGFAAVLIGLGLDYCIHGATRFHESRAAGASSIESLRSAVKLSGPAIVASAITTATAFGTLLAASLPPLRELGLLVMFGMSMMLVSAYLVGGGLLVAFSRAEDHRPTLLWRSAGRLVEAAVGLAASNRKAVWSAALALSVLAALGVPNLEVNADLRALRPADHPTDVAETALSEAFDLGFDTATLVIRGETRDEVLERSREVGALLRASLPVGAQVTTPGDWLSTDSRMRLERLERSSLGHRIEQLESELYSAGFRVSGFEPGLSALRQLAEGVDPAPADIDAPDWIERQLAEVEDDSTFLAAVDLRVLSEDSLEAVVEQPLRGEIERLAPGFELAAPALVGRDLRRYARADLRRLLILGLSAVTLVVLFSFRFSWLAALYSLTPVLLGSLWTVGIWGLIDGRMDLFSLSVLPILLGIGVDDGLHAVHGMSLRKGDPGVCISSAVRSAGRAMTLTTLTTAAGFGSLGLSSVPGLQRGGLLVSLGVLSCLAATLLVLPTLPSPGRPSGHTSGEGSLPESE